MKKGLLIIIGSVIIIAIVGAIFIYRILFVPNGIKIDKIQYPITGIDVSEHTGKIDFLKISNQQIDFVYIKATEGVNFVDPKFGENYFNANLTNIPIGFYHFFRFNKDGKSQADNFLKNIKGKKADLPLVIDVEEWGNLSEEITENVINEIREFITSVEKKSKKKMMIYSNESSYKKYIMGNFDDNDIWICSFSKSPNIKQKWTFWQHSHKGKLNNSNSWFDINTFNGTKGEWKRYLKKREFGITFE
ncbi:glycoside hydrolase family 25 protein [Emticicia sp.]|uniref:glycoside hydrolase family 25 protein n=1 Tax=Emticicia sp. TaxID=1930953 RepID=UPI0037524993